MIIAERTVVSSLLLSEIPRWSLLSQNLRACGKIEGNNVEINISHADYFVASQPFQSL